MIKASRLELISLVVLWGVIVYCWGWLLAPASSPLEYLINPAYVAMIGATVSTAVYSAVAVFIESPIIWKRALLALFLAGMPFVYLWAAVLSHDPGAVVLESVGALIFVPLAVLGYRRSFSILGLGIAAHGIAWDVWHRSHASYIEPWYPVGCLIVDLAFAGVALAGAVRIKAKVAEEPAVLSAKPTNVN